MRGVDLEVLVPVPAPGVRAAQGWVRRSRGLAEVTDAVVSAIRGLDPKPTLVPFIPVPRRSHESAALSLSAAMIARAPARRPRWVQGSRLDAAGFAAVFVARSLDVPSIAVALGRDLGGLDAGRERRVRFATRHATELLAVTSSVARLLAERGRTAMVVPFGPLPDELPLQPAAAHARALCVGEVGPSHATIVLLDAFAATSVNGLDESAELVLVGPVEPGFDLDRALRQRSLSARVRYAGDVDRVGLRSFYAESGCVVVPDRSIGVPGHAVEALLSGRPVVAVEGPGVAELLDESVGRVVPAGDPASLRRAIGEVLERRDRFEGSRLRERGLAFSADATRRGLGELTQRLLAREERAELS